MPVTIDGTTGINLGTASLTNTGGLNLGTVTVDNTSGASLVSATSTPFLVGQVCFFAMNSAPAGFLKCNGAAVSRTTYSALFSAIGTTYGAGNGSTTFALPDLRGEFLRCWDDGRGIDSGRAIGSSQGDAIRNISGQILDFTSNISRTEPGAANGAFFSSLGVSYNGAVSGAGPASYPDRVSMDASRQVPTAGENRPRSIALLACIKF